MKTYFPLKDIIPSPSKQGGDKDKGSARRRTREAGGLRPSVAGPTVREGGTVTPSTTSRAAGFARDQA